MSQFRVVAPCAYVVDGAAVHHREPGALVDLTFNVAADLGDAVEPIAPPQPPTRHKIKPPKAEASSPAEGEEHPGDDGVC